MSESDLQATIDGWVSSALSQRFNQHLPPIESRADDVIQSLVECRAALDYVEEILASCIRLRGRASRASEAASIASEDAWDAAANQSSTSGTRKGGDFVGPRERYADFNLSCLGQRRAARIAADQLSRVEEAYQVVRQCHRGLDTLRHDHSQMLSALSYARVMEHSGEPSG